MNDQRMRFARRGLAWGVATGAFWGLDGVLLGIALGFAPFTGNASLLIAPLAAAGLHDGFAALWLLLINAANGKLRELPRALATKPGRVVCLAAIFGGPVGMAGYLLGIAHAGAAYAMAVSALYPAVGAVLAAVMLKEKITGRAAAGIVAAVAGALITACSPQSAQTSPHFYMGLGFAVLAAVGWGLESVLSTLGMDLLDPDIAINIRQAMSFVVYLCVVLPLVGGNRMLFAAATGGQSAPIMALAGLTGALSYLSWYKALNMTGVARAMSLSITYAMWSIVFSVLLTRTQVTWNLVVGAAVITVGAVLIVSNPKELLNLRK